MMYKTKYNMQLGSYVEMIDNSDPSQICRFKWTYIVLSIFDKAGIIKAIDNIVKYVTDTHDSIKDDILTRFRYSRSRYIMARCLLLALDAGTMSKMMSEDYNNKYKSNRKRLKSDVLLWRIRAKTLQNEIAERGKQRESELKNSAQDDITTTSLVLGININLDQTVNEYGSYIRAAKTKISLLTNKNKTNV